MGLFVTRADKVRANAKQSANVTAIALVNATMEPLEKPPQNQDR